MLQPHTIRPARGAKHSVKKIGRGNASGHGTSSGRGGKGQTARSGGSRGIQARAFKFLLQSTPKLRGFTSIAVKPAEVSLSDLETKFNVGETVDLAALKAKRIVPRAAAAAKILSSGALNKKLTIVGIKASKVAAEKITAAGGEIK